MIEQELQNVKAILKDNQQIIAKERKYFNSAVLIPLLNIDGTYHFLFQRRASGISQPHEICFPGGKYEAKVDSNYQETAIRETKEELGVLAENINLLGKLGTIVAPLGVTIDAFVGQLNITDIDNLDLNHKEVLEVFTIPVEYFENNHPQEYFVRVQMHPYDVNQEGEKVTLLPVEELDLPEKYATPWSGHQHNVLVYSTTQGVIWGITAELITELINKFEPLDFI